MNEFQGINDDTRSMISMQSNLTGFSRKSGVSMLDIDSIVSTGSKRAPGERGLKEAAQRRAQKAQMASIEANLTRISHTEDLSYSGGEAGKIDGITLARLIDECREEQE